MSVARRDVLRAGLVAGAGAALAGCAPLARRVAGRKLPADITLPERTGSEAHRFLNRIAFGPIPGEPRRVVEMGYDAYLKEQLHPTDDDELVLKFELGRLDIMRSGSAELRDLPEGNVLRQLRQAVILRAVYSRWQLRERMVDFWTNHFNIFAYKGDGAYRKGVDDLSVIRANALGSFPDMIRASARSVAMLGYLDNQFNRKGVPNENYARELMELHTLGVHGGYTQQDVKEVARCFTGWTIENRFLRPRDHFRFDPDAHDDGAKLVLGHVIPAGGGIKDGDQVIDIVTSNPACHAFLAKKLCHFFLGDAGARVEPLVADAYARSGGDVRTMLGPILASDELRHGPAILKRPFDYAISAMRAVGADTDGGPAVHEHLDRMGQGLFSWPMPDGYPDKSAAWTGTVLARWNFAVALANNELGGTHYEVEPLAGHIYELTHGKGSGGSTQDDVALALASPEFQWR